MGSVHAQWSLPLTQFSLPLSLTGVPLLRVHSVGWSVGNRGQSAPSTGRPVGIE